MNIQTPLRILMVEDNENDRLLEERELKKASIPHVLICVDSRQDFLQQLAQFHADLILCDYSLPQFNALDVLEIVQEQAPQIPVVIVTGTLTDETAVECLKRGALDYVIKERIVRLPFAISRALEHRRFMEQKQADEERLRQSEKMLRVVTGVLPALLVYLTPDLQVHFCNRIYDKWFPNSNKDVLRKTATEAFGETISDEIAARLPQVLSGEEAKFESPYGPQVSAQVASITLTPDQEPSGLVKGIVCLMTDVSVQKHYEEELLFAKEQADSANEAKSQFLANMSHEMRTPLSAMLGFAELLMISDLPEEERSDWLGRIIRNCERLKKMIDEILDLSKVEAGKLEVQRGPTSVVEVISQVKSMLFPLAREKNLQLKFEIVGSLPETIDSDPVKLRHIFINIIGNAVKFSEVGPITTRAESTSDGKLSFSVEDHGSGLTHEQSEHLFEPFTQVDSSMTRKVGGTGLGLALARRYARALGGDVRLTHSVPNEGSTFTITIDPGDVSDEKTISTFETDVSESVPFVKIQQAHLAHLKVLVVDDVLDNQVLVRKFLERAGSEVEVASDGQEAVEKALHTPYDLILMDLQMPVLDGYNATTRLRAQGYTKPILALTAHALKDEQERCLKMGFNGFLTKPIRQNDLLTELSHFKH
ncbi:MAG: response regulator [Pseudobdellovibrionaceae bacterium]